MEKLPKKLPVVQTHPVLQLLKWTFDPLKFLESCAQQYGDCFAVNLSVFAREVVFISHPDTVAELFAPANAHLFDSGIAQVILRLPLGDNSALVLDGAQHRRHRQLLMPPLHGERLRKYGSTICEITEQLAQEWKVGEPFPMIHTTNEITLQVMLKTVFGVHEGKRYDRLRKQVKKFLDSFSSPLLYLVAVVPFLHHDWGAWSPAGRYLRLIRELDDLLYTEIRDRREALNPDADDVLTMLLLARDEAGEAMSDQEVRDEILTLLVAGHDSTAATLAWSFYWILSTPSVEMRLREELATLDDPNDPLSISRLPYLNAVCQESLRLRSAGPAVSPRVTKTTVRLDGYEFPPGTVVTPSQHLTHHRADIYPDPDRFDPDRFLNQQYSPSEYYPFGGGSRRCLGAAFAQYETKLVIATLLQRYMLTLAESKPVRAARRHVNITPAGGVRLIAEKRPMWRKRSEMPVSVR
jgi:cytochrome P450 family 110